MFARSRGLAVSRCFALPPTPRNLATGMTRHCAQCSNQLRGASLYLLHHETLRQQCNAIVRNARTTSTPRDLETSRPRDPATARPRNPATARPRNRETPQPLNRDPQLPRPQPRKRGCGDRRVNQAVERRLHCDTPRTAVPDRQLPKRNGVPDERDRHEDAGDVDGSGGRR